LIQKGLILASGKAGIIFATARGQKMLLMDGR